MSTKLTDPAPRLLQRLVGACALALGFALTAITVALALALPQAVGGVSPGLLALVFVIGALSVFLVNVGFRLALNRPNRYGSSLSPLTWYLVGALFFICGGALSVAAVSSGSLSGFEPVAYSAGFGGLSVFIGWRARAKRPPQNSAA